MHELSIVASLFEIMEEKAQEKGSKAVISVKLQVGKLSGVLDRSLDDDRCCQLCSGVDDRSHRVVVQDVERTHCITPAPCLLQHHSHVHSSHMAPLTPSVPARPIHLTSTASQHVNG